jgi:hypothetical protein
MARGQFLQFRFFGSAFRYGVLATRLERATSGRAHHVWRLAFNRSQTGFARFVQPWDGSQESGGIGVKRVVINFESRTMFDYHSCVHYINSPGVTGHDS